MGASPSGPIQDSNPPSSEATTPTVGISMAPAMADEPDYKPPQHQKSHGISAIADADTRPVVPGCFTSFIAKRPGVTALAWNLTVCAPAQSLRATYSTESG